MGDDLKNRGYLTPNEVAARLMVSPGTVRHWAQRGWLQALTTPGGHRRFLHREVERFARERGLTMQAPDAGPLRVLIVDDDSTLAGFLVELFENLQEAILAEAAYDGFDAGRKVHTFEPRVVLLDLMMPGMDGFEVCRSLKNDPITKTIRIFAMTGHRNQKNIARIMRLGAEACFSKPLDIPTVLKTIGIRSRYAPPLK